MARAFVTHPQQAAAAELDGECFCTEDVAPLVRRRWPRAAVRPLAYRERRTMGASVVSLHPSGHALGAAQIRVETEAGIAVIAGAYKRVADPTCAPFELVHADTFVTDATFALPIFRWPDPNGVAADLQAWWEAGRHAQRSSIVFVDEASTAARLLGLLARRGAPSVAVEESLAPMLDVYRAHGIAMPETPLVPARGGRRGHAGALFVVPLTTSTREWTRRFPGAATAFASGMVSLRGARRRLAVDRGFVISDRPDWEQILQTVDETRAGRVGATGRHAPVLARYLRERNGNVDAMVLEGPPAA